MIRIGVVGDIGSGKSYVANQFGYPVFNADLEVSKLYNKDRKIYIKLKKVLPSYIISYPIKKNKLTEAILSNIKNLKKINKVVHPLIRKKMNNFLKKNKQKKIVVLDIPLLIENKINRKNDIIIFVDAPKKKIDKRLMKRPNFSFTILKKLKKLQLPVELKRKKSDFVIKNDFKKHSIKKNVNSIIKKILLNA
jgi:dephospho-CoA kinase